MLPEISENVYDFCFELLNFRGNLVLEDPLTLVIRYEEKNIQVTGVLDDSHNAFSRVYVSINLPPEEVKNPKIIENNIFALDHQNRNWTTVYIWRRVPRYFRPGNWVKYLVKLIEQDRSDATKADRLNGVTVDDSKLFVE